MEKLWTTSEVASFLSITERDVEELVRQGVLTAYQLGGRFLRFRPQQVEAIKGKVRFRPTAKHSGAAVTRSPGQRLRDFVYFYDFYIISATLLACMVVYLIVAG